MEIAEKRRKYKKQIENHFHSLQKSLQTLLYSFDKCRRIGVKSEYGLEEQESFEALTARFARTSDILTQKVIKSLFMLLQEDVKTIIDTANFLEKLEIIETADHLLNIREVRNQIAHEYILSDTGALYDDVMNYVPVLQDLVQKIGVYYQKISKN